MITKQYLIFIQSFKPVQVRVYIFSIFHTDSARFILIRQHISTVCPELVYGSGPRLSRLLQQIQYTLHKYSQNAVDMEEHYMNFLRLFFNAI